MILVPPVPRRSISQNAPYFHKYLEGTLGALLLLLTSAFFLIVFVAVPHKVAAEGLIVRPIRIDLNDDQKNDAVTVTNNEETAQILRVDAVGWDQSSGEDVYTANADADLFLVPPVLNLEAGESRVARLGLRHSFEGTRERAFRLFITEVPSALSPASTVSFMFRVGIPVFVATGKPVSAQPVWKAQFDGPKHIRLTASNPGDTHVRIDMVRMYADASKKQEISAHEEREYLLAGAVRSFTLEMPTLSSSPLLAIEGSDAQDVPFVATVPVVPSRSAAR